MRARDATQCQTLKSPIFNVCVWGVSNSFNFSYLLTRTDNRQIGRVSILGSEPTYLLKVELGRIVLVMQLAGGSAGYELITQAQQNLGLGCSTKPANYSLPEIRPRGIKGHSRVGF